MIVIRWYCRIIASEKRFRKLNLSKIVTEINNMHQKLQDLLKLTGDEKFPDSSELHGVLCAHALQVKQDHSAAGAQAAEELAKWLDLAGEQTDLLASALAEEHSALTRQAMDYQLYLPDDGQSLNLRTRALAAWCGGFVSGIGVYEDWLPEAPAAAGNSAAKSSEQVQEAIADLSQIARAGLESETGSESEEQAYAEIVEYVRVAVQLIQASLQPGPADQVDTPAVPPVLH